MAPDYATHSHSQSSRTELLTTKESVKETGLIEITVEKSFYSYNEFSHQCECMQGRSYKQFMNKNSN